MIRYKKLGYVELNVSDLEKSRKFYEDIVGLEYVGKRSDGAVMFRCDDEDPRSVVLHQKQPAGFKSVGWTLEDDSQFELLHRRLRDASVAYEELGASQCDLRQATRVTRTVEPHSHAALEFFTPPACVRISRSRPHTPRSSVLAMSCGRCRRKPNRSAFSATC